MPENDACSRLCSRAVPSSHFKCRNATYGKMGVMRFFVPQEKVLWSVAFPEYRPLYHVEKSVFDETGTSPPWADPESCFDSKSPTVHWNVLGEKVDRRSHMGLYRIDRRHGVPINPVGRTGIIGRGLLGRWGPNHAADPIVTRWKRDSNGNVTLHADGKGILQFVAILRRDTGEWAIPGGMVDPGEQISITLKREFAEEAMNILETEVESDRHSIEALIADTFHSAAEVYRGYVDDPRNTDNSWMETVAVNAHDETGSSVGKLKLHAGDDAKGVRWIDLDSALRLYASHTDFLHKVALLRNAHW